MKLFALYEADLSRRGFLKFLGAAAGSTVPSFVPGAGILKFISGMGDSSNKYLKYLKAYKNSNISDDVIDDNIMWGISNAATDTGYKLTVPINIIKGYMIDQTNEQDNIAQWLGGDTCPTYKLGNFYNDLIDGVVKKIGPKNALNQMVNSQGSLGFDAGHNVGSLMDYSNTFNKFMSQFGIDLQTWEDLYRGEAKAIDFFKEQHMISPEKAESIKEKMRVREAEYEEYLKQDKEWDRKRKEALKKGKMEKEKMEKEKMLRQQQQRRHHIMHPSEPKGYGPKDFGKTLDQALSPLP